MYEKIEINHLRLSVRRDQRFIIIINKRYNTNMPSRVGIVFREERRACNDSSLRVKRYLEDIVVTLVFDRLLLFAVPVCGR